MFARRGRSGENNNLATVFGALTGNRMQP